MLIKNKIIINSTVYNLQYYLDRTSPKPIHLNLISKETISYCHHNGKSMLSCGGVVYYVNWMKAKEIITKYLQ